VKKSAKLKGAKTPTKRRYVESHWLIFGLQGVIALVSGAYMLFANNQDVSRLVTVVGSVLLALGAIEILNIIHRQLRQRSWGIPLAVAIFETAIGITMICLNRETYVLHIALLAGYTLVRGVTSIVIGFVSFKDMTNRFFWVACGMVGSVIGFIIFADPGISDTFFVKLFGTFMMVLGLTNVFYAIHSRDEVKQLKSGKKAKK
jgi:uncharacterized membrane protein HdeD (DUF308 family)